MSTADHYDVLDRVLAPFAASLSPAAAENIANFQTDARTLARVDELADKANEGTLSVDEQTEYDKYLDALSLITILQAKARARKNSAVDQ
jgi:hypothetical protein